MTTYFCHTSSGHLQFDPNPPGVRFQPGWAIMQCDPNIIDLYCWYSIKHGRPIVKNKLWGAHVSVVKGEDCDSPLWGTDFGQIEFRYTNQIRYDNGCHAWLDVECERLHEIRALLDLPSYPQNRKEQRMSLHLTLGRWR